MVLSLSHILFLSVAIDAAAIAPSFPSIKSRNTIANTTTANTTSLPIGASNTTARAAAINIKREGWGYGPSKLGNNSYYPNGSLGDARSVSDQALFTVIQDVIEEVVDGDLELAEEVLLPIGGFTTLEDYNLLYENQWLNAVPDGLDPGLLTNYTQDLLFSMSRLSVNPYPVTRLHPNTTLPFSLPNSLVSKITNGSTITSLLTSGSLFFVDHSYQSAYPHSTSLYAAYCSAYFYISPLTGDFLPMAIKTNYGSDLIYTPLDSSLDWLLAKIMFNVNDAFHAQLFHVSNSHSVAEIVYESAIRTLSDSHPLLALLDRIMYMAYAVRPQGELALFAEGGFLDTYFAFNHIGAEMLIDDFYPIGGAFQGQYLETDLTTRGLLNSSFGPPLPSIPYYSDALPIHTSLKTFFTKVISSYYTSDALVLSDTELQNWILEANGPAAVIDFPDEVKTVETVIEIMTHMAFTTGVTHHVLNSGSPVHGGSFLPFRPLALFAEIPVAKNVSDIMPYLTPLEYALANMDLLADFNRPLFPEMGLTVEFFFDNDTLLNRLNEESRNAAATFKTEMLAQAAVVGNRTFDEDGLSQGMPFIYRQINPGTLPFFLTV